MLRATFVSLVVFAFSAHTTARSLRFGFDTQGLCRRVHGLLGELTWNVPGGTYRTWGTCSTGAAGHCEAMIFRGPPDAMVKRPL